MEKKPPTYQFLAFLLVLETLVLLVCLHHLCQVGDELVSLCQEVGQTFVLLLVNQLAVTFFILQHESPQSLLFDPLLLLLFLPLGIHVVHQQGLVQLVDLLRVLSVELPVWWRWGLVVVVE